MDVLNCKVKGATLIESLIAMIVMVVCLSIGTMIYTNVLNSDKQRLKLKTILLLNEEVAQIKKEKNFLDGEKEIGDYVVKRIIKKVPQTENLYELDLLALDKEGKVIGTRNEFIIANE